MPNAASQSWCALPWQGVVLQPWGDVQVCCLVDSVSKPDIKSYLASAELQDLKDSMLAGERPAACNVCWKNENQSLASWRQKKNLQLSSQLTAAQAGDRLFHRTDYIELYISNKCNSKCRMCKPKWSTAWIPDYHDQEIKNIFGYSVELEKKVVRYNHLNTEQLDQLLDIINNKDEHTCISLRGGEPCYADETMYLLSNIKDKSKVSLDLTTNGTILDADFLDLISHFSDILLGVSIDASNGLNQYIRGNETPVPKILENTKSFLKLDNVTQFFISNTIMIYNAFNNHKLKTECEKSLGFVPTYDDKVLYNPAHLKIHILPNYEKQLITHVPTAEAAHTGREDAALLEKWFRFTERLDKLRGQDVSVSVPELKTLYNHLEKSVHG